MLFHRLLEQAVETRHRHLRYQDLVTRSVPKKSKPTPPPTTARGTAPRSLAAAEKLDAVGSASRWMALLNRNLRPGTPPPLPLRRLSLHDLSLHELSLPRERVGVDRTRRAQRLD